MDKEKIIILGVGLSPDDLTSAHLETIRSADLLLGGRRHLAYFQDLPVEKQTIAGDLEAILALLRAQPPGRRVVVLASGDPLLFGIGGRIVAELGAERVHIVPNVSSIAAAFARIGRPWQAAALVSLHGRKDIAALGVALKTRPLVAVLTDPQHHPAWLAAWLLEKGAGHLRLAVFERLGLPEERFDWYSPAQAAAAAFGDPNLVVILSDEEPETAGPKLRLGLGEEAYAHENGLITKPEVRAVVLARLALAPGLTLWDLGAGSGAVGIEASLLLGAGRVVAVEQKPERVALIQENARRYRVYNHEALCARLPDGLDRLPPPNRIFIGGGGADLPAIVRKSAGHLEPDGVMVINTILLDNLGPAIASLEDCGLAVEVVQLQIQRSRPMPWSRRLAAENAVWVIRGSKAEKAEG